MRSTMFTAAVALLCLMAANASAIAEDSGPRKSHNEATTTLASI